MLAGGRDSSFLLAMDRFQFIFGGDFVILISVSRWQPYIGWIVILVISISLWQDGCFPHMCENLYYVVAYARYVFRPSLWGEPDHLYGGIPDHQGYVW